MARPTKFTPDLVQRLLYLLSCGCNVADSCAEVGISEQTYRNWRNESKRLEDDANRRMNACITPDELLFLGFFGATTRAQARARVTAVMAVNTGLVATEQVETVIEAFTETRFRRGKDGVEIPYEYRRTLHKTVVREIPPDWRAGIEYLKRRMPEEWSDRIKVEDWHDRVIADIQDGLIDYEEFAKAFDYDLATKLFKAAGVPVPSGEGAG